MRPERGEMMFGSAINHVISRSVRDSAAMLDATQGPELASAFRIAPPQRPYLEEVSRDGERLQIAFSTRSPFGGPVVPKDFVMPLSRRSGAVINLPP